MRKYFKLPRREPGKSNILRKLRERILKTTLISSFLIGTVLYGFALIPAFQKGLYSTILIYTILYMGLILITFVPRLPYRLRAVCWLGLAYILGGLNLALSGFNVDAGLFFITFVAMALLLLGLPFGLMALALSCITISVAAFVNVSEYIDLSMGLSQSNPLLWIIGGIVFLLMGIFVIYSLSIVVYGLEENLEKATLLTNELEQTNESLRMSEARYRTLVETSPGLVVLLDLNGNILMANQVGLTLFGYENLEEVAGKNMRVFFAPDEQARLLEAFQRTLETGESRDFECLAHRKDGTLFFAEFSSALVLDEASRLQAVIAVGRDITARKEAEKILQEAKDALAARVVETTVQLKQTSDRLEELVKYGPTVVYSYRASDFALTYVSENVAALVGFTSPEFSEGEFFWERVHPEDKKQIFAMREHGRIQDRYVYEYRFLHKDGAYRWLRDERVLIRDRHGNPLEYIGSCSEITDQKNAEQSLKISEAKYRSLYESMMDAYILVDMRGRIQEFNQAYARMLGYASDELYKLTYQDLTPKKWHDFEMEIIEKQVLSRGYSEIYEKEYTRKSGEVFPVELRTELIRDGLGNHTGMWAIIRDISERKTSEQTLRESEERYRGLLENSMQGVLVFQDMRIVYGNTAVLETLGYEQAELKSLKMSEILKRVYADDRVMFHDTLHRSLEGVPTPGQYPMRVIHKNGEIKWLEARTLPIELQGKPALMITTIDVSQIKKAEAQLQENERLLRTILNASDALVFLLDTNGILIASNVKFAERMGMMADSMVGTAVYDILPFEVAKARKVPFDQVINSGKPITFVDSREGFWFENSLFPILDETGKVKSVAVYARDISEQRRVTEALRASEEKYRTLAEAAHDVIFIINRDNRMDYVNSFGANYLGLKPEQIVGQALSSFIPPDKWEDLILQVLKTGEAISIEDAYKFVTRTVWFSTWLVPLKDASGEITSMLGVARDITERKQFEEALEHAREQLEERVAERTKELSVTQEQLHLLTAQTVKTQEEERRSISRELHDEAGQALITLKYGLAAIQSELPKSDALTRQRLSDSMKIIDQTMLHIRALAHSLRPPVLEVGGIHLSLQDYCREVSERAQIPILYLGEEIPGLPDEIGISLFRFVQEALTNIMKHAQATKVKVRLQCKKAEISLSVSDNGRGMEDANQAEGLGLLGVKERLSLLGGKLDILSQTGRGAKLVARVPWVTPAIE